MSGRESVKNPASVDPRQNAAAAAAAAAMKNENQEPREHSDVVRKTLRQNGNGHSLDTGIPIQNA